MKDEEILRLIELLSEETRQTKKLANAAERTALVAIKNANTAWEMANVAREEATKVD